MSHDPNIEDLIAPFGADALREALREAFRRGEESMRTKMLSVLDAAPQAATSHGAPSPPSPEAQPADDVGGGTRAPRGLAREVIDMILRSGSPMPTAEIQAMATHLDERITAKTVYNELNRGKDKLYRLSMGRWSLIALQGSAEARDEMEGWLGKAEPA